MDTINHTTQGIILSYVSTNNILFSIIFGLTASIPDVYGEYRARYKGDVNYEWYARVHSRFHWLWLFPPILLHILLDKVTHGKGKRWYAGINYDKTNIDAKFWEYFCPWRWRERMWFQSFTWCVNLFLIFNFLIGFLYK